MQKTLELGRYLSSFIKHEDDVVALGKIDNRRGRIPGFPIL